MPIMPALVAEYAERVCKPSAPRDEIMMMRPKPFAFMPGSVACTS